jgi:tetratricopeptide (TPR) repeat protein
MATTSLPGYTSAEVARMLGLSARQIRSYVQADFLSPRRGPRREFRFSFQDLVVLRAARDLVDQRVPTRRVRRVLAKLRRQLPRGRSLAALRISFEGGEVVVRAEGEIWNPESGQLLLDFQVADLARQAAPLAGRLISRAGDPESLSAEDWYELGFELEASALEEAKNAYQRGLELDPMHADAHLNLGRLIHEEGAAEEAEAHYRTALRIRPKDSTAAYNLGVALQDRGCLEEALTAYRRAVTLDAGFADAYYNMAGIHEELGKVAVAIQNLKTYIRLEGLQLARPGRHRRPR